MQIIFGRAVYGCRARTKASCLSRIVASERKPRGGSIDSRSTVVPSGEGSTGMGIVWTRRASDAGNRWGLVGFGIWTVHRAGRPRASLKARSPDASFDNV